MAENTIVKLFNGLVQFRQDTYSNWSSEGKKVQNGEIIIVTQADSEENNNYLLINSTGSSSIFSELWNNGNKILIPKNSSEPTLDVHYVEISNNNPWSNLKSGVYIGKDNTYSIEEIVVPQLFLCQIFDTEQGQPKSIIKIHIGADKDLPMADDWQNIIISAGTITSSGLDVKPLNTIFFKDQNIRQYSSTIGDWNEDSVAFNKTEIEHGVKRSVAFNSGKILSGVEDSMVQGIGTQAYCEGQHVEGKYNIVPSNIQDENKFLHIVGNGTKDNPSNAYTLSQDGEGWFLKDVTAAKGTDNKPLHKLSEKEDFSNKTDTIDENSTDIQYPTAKAVYEIIKAITDKISTAASASNQLADKQFIYDEINKINVKIPTAASASNQLADKQFIYDYLEKGDKDYLTRDNNGNPFSTKAELDAATIFYSGGIEKEPQKNDYTIVIKDESKISGSSSEGPTTKYIYNNGWQYQYIINNTPWTGSQLNALNSGLTAADKTKLDSIASNAEVNVQSDWNQTDNTKDDFIKNKPDVYTKIETDNLLISKIDITEGKSLIEDTKISKLDALPTSQELTNTLNTKSDKSNTYTKTEVDAKLFSVYKFKGSKTTEEINALTDMQDGDVYNITNAGMILPQSTVVMPGDNIAWVENESKWDVLAQVVDLSQYYTKLETDHLLYQKVDFEAGKGLSTEDYTTQEKNKLSGIEAGAKANVLEGIQINGEDLSVSNKKVNIPMAGEFNPGVVCVDNISGIKLSNNILTLNPAGPAEIDSRIDNMPITTENLDYAVKSVRPVISNTINGTLLINTIYDIGEMNPLTLTLPTNPKYGDFVQVDLLTGENTFNLTVESTLGLTDVDFVPDKHKIYSLFFDYGRIGSDLWGWRFSYAEYEDSEV